MTTFVLRNPARRGAAVVQLLYWPVTQSSVARRLWLINIIYYSAKKWLCVSVYAVTYPQSISTRLFHEPSSDANYRGQWYLVLALRDQCWISESCSYHGAVYMSVSNTVQPILKTHSANAKTVSSFNNTSCLTDENFCMKDFWSCFFALPTERYQKVKNKQLRKQRLVIRIERLL